MQSLFAQFQTRYPSGGLITELLTVHDGNYVVRALVNVGDRAIATGMAAAPTVEAAEDQARLRALQVFNQLSNPIGLPESPVLTPQLFPAGLPIQPSLQTNVAAVHTSVTPSVDPVAANPSNDAANLVPSSVRPAQSPPVQASPSPIESPIVPAPLSPLSVNGGNGGSGVASASLAASAVSQPKPSPVSDPANAPKSAASSASTPVLEEAAWSVELSAIPDSTLPTNFSIASVTRSTSTRPVADLYAAATEESETPSWDRLATPADPPQSSDLAFQNDPEPLDNQAIPFFDDDPLEPDYPSEDFAPPTETEAGVVAAAKSTKAKTAKSTKPTKSSSSKAPAAEPAVNQVVDRSDEIAQIDVEMRRLGWSKQDGRKHLEETYNKRSRQQLTDDELLAFLAYLQSQPSPSQSPF